MDLFHAITSEIENVISCHWLDEFRQSRSGKTSSTANTPAGGASRSSSVVPSISRSNSSLSLSKDIGSKTLSRSNSSASIPQADKMGLDTKLMDTEAGGESTQYESIKTVTVPPRKDGGQLGEPESSTEKPGVDPERAERTADNIRYGQNISESGMGGMTTTSSGSANQEGGFGGTEAQENAEKSGNSRTAQQYSAGDNTHDHKVGG